MIIVYSRTDGLFETMPWTAGDPFPIGAIWVDAENPTEDEIYELQMTLGIPLPTKEERERNITLSRMFKADGVSFMNAAVITKALGPYPELSVVRFILTENTLLSVRDIQPTSFENFALRFQNSSKDFDSGPEILQGLLEEMVLRVAYNSDLVTNDLDRLSHRIFDPYGLNENEDISLQDVLRQLGVAADLNSQVHESLHSLARMVAFFKESQSDNQYLVRKLDVLSQDIRELGQQSAFLSDKITFQLDATLGMINVEQNLSMKILSIFTMVIMPPTLIGSIYGMNFQFMPELSQPWGYPLALTAMLTSAILPFLYFRKRRWL
jgi:magnesium transporter